MITDAQRDYYDYFKESRSNKIVVAHERKDGTMIIEVKDNPDREWRFREPKPSDRMEYLELVSPEGTLLRCATQTSEWDVRE